MADWTGLSVGLSAGYGNGEIATEFQGFFAETNTRTDVGGGLLGANLGYAFQSGHLVFGPELSVMASTVSGSSQAAFGLETQTDSLEWLANANMRLGLARDDLLFYATGGLSLGQVDAERCSNSNPSCIFEPNVLHAGWNLGLGVEKMLNQHFVAGIEYRYVDLEEVTHNGENNFGAPPDLRLHDVDPDFHAVNIRLKWLI